MGNEVTTFSFTVLSQKYRLRGVHTQKFIDSDMFRLEMFFKKRNLKSRAIHKDGFLLSNLSDFLNFFNLIIISVT